MTVGFKVFVTIAGPNKGGQTDQNVKARYIILSVEPSSTKIFRFVHDLLAIVSCRLLLDEPMEANGRPL